MASKDLETVRAPRSTGDLIMKLQVALNDRVIVAFPQPLTKGKVCSHTEKVADRLVGCAELAVFLYVHEEVCTTCGHLNKDTEKPFCISHMALSVAGRLQPPQTSLLEVDPNTHTVPATTDHDAEAEAIEAAEAAARASDASPTSDEREAEIVLSGSTGAPIAPEGTTYAMTPSAENETLCVCGWVIDSPIAGHDERHHRFALATGEAADVPPPKPKTTTRVKKAADTPPPPKRKGATR